MASDPELLAHQRMARLRAAGRPRRLPPGAARGRSATSTATSSPTSSDSSPCLPRGQADGEIDPRDPRLPRVRYARCSAGSQADLVPTRAARRVARSRPARVRRDAPPDLRGPRVRAEGPQAPVAPARPGAAARDRPRRGRRSATAATGRRRRRPASSGCCARPRCPIGLLSNGTHLRLVYAPRGETCGHLTFPVADMTEVAGRPIFAALHMLLSAERLFSAARQAAPARAPRREPQVPERRLHASSPSRCWPRSTSCCAASRRPTISARASCSARCWPHDPNQVYAGLLTVLLRLVFLLYAEDRGLLSDDEVYAELLLGHRPVRAAARGRRPLPGHDGPALRRLGAAPGALPPGPRRRQPRRLADCRPARATSSIPTATRSSKAGQARRSAGEPRRAPRVSDGVHLPRAAEPARPRRRAAQLPHARRRADRLRLRDDDGLPPGGRPGRSIAIKPKKPHGAPTTINLEELLARSPATAASGSRSSTDQKRDRPGRRRAEGGRHASRTCSRRWSGRSPATSRRTSCRRGRWSSSRRDERRRCGSHYTPRVAHRADRPQDARADPGAAWRAADAGADPRPEGLRPGDGLGRVPGRGCRQLGDALVKAWHVHEQAAADSAGRGRDAARPPARRPALPLRRGQEPDGGRPGQAVALAGDAGEGPPLHVPRPRAAARRLAGRADAQADRRLPLEADAAAQTSARTSSRNASSRDAASARRSSRPATMCPFLLKQQKLAVADEALNLVRFAGNLVIAAFFAETTTRSGRPGGMTCSDSSQTFCALATWRCGRPKAERELAHRRQAVHPFHWEIEFPEVFGRENGGLRCDRGQSAVSRAGR